MKDDLRNCQIIPITVKDHKKTPYIYINFIRTLNQPLVETIKKK